MDPIIRPAVAEDAPALLAFVTRLFGEDLPGIFRRPIPTLEDEIAFISTRVSQANGTLLIAEADGRIVGSIGLVGEELPEEAHSATFGLSVDCDWRGQGVGGALIEALAVWAAEHRVSRLQALVWETNPRALALYERHGFQREGLLRRAVIRDGEPIDVILVARLLDAPQARGAEVGASS